MIHLKRFIYGALCMTFLFFMLFSPLLLIVAVFEYPQYGFPALFLLVVAFMVFMTYECGKEVMNDWNKK